MSLPITLPREIVKWIHSLDLSYSFKDMKRDLTNGFFVAEILSRYYPGKISLHSFDNSQNQERRKNNWNIIELFFKKNEIPITKRDFEKIMNDNDMNAVVEFMSKLYTFLTQRKVVKSPLVHFLQINQNIYHDKKNDKGLGTSFILKDKGLEKLEDKRVLQGGDIVNHQKENAEKEKEKEKEKETRFEESSLSVSNISKKTNFLRNFNKPISQNLESANLQIDVKSINVRQVNLNFSRMKDQEESTSKILSADLQGRKGNRKSVEHSMKISAPEMDLKASSGFANESGKNMSSPVKKEKQVEKTIFDALNEIITIRFSIKNFSEELKKVKVKNSTILQAYCDNIDIFSDEFSSTFFEELHKETDSLIKFVFKDQNELWKYINFLVTCLSGLVNEGTSFFVLVEAIRVFGEKCLEYNPQNAFRTKIMFQNYYLQDLAFLIKKCQKFRRKEAMLKIIYAFSPADGPSRFEMLMAYKKVLNCRTTYMQSLAVLMRYEGASTDDNKLIVKELYDNAKLNLFATSSISRTMSLAILNHLCEIEPILINKLIESQINLIANCDWWETKCLAVSLFSKLIRSIVESEKYQSLLKQNNSTHKSFSLENEQLMIALTSKIESLIKGMQMVALPPANEHILRISFIALSPIMGDNKAAIELFIHLFLLSNEEVRRWVLYSRGGGREEEERRREEEISRREEGGRREEGVGKREEELEREEYLVENDRSLKYKVNIKSEEFEKYASNILIYVVEMIKEIKLDRLTAEYLDLIVYGYLYTDFKMINMELCENINNSLKEYVFISLCDDEMCENTKTVLNQMLKLQFFSEVKIRDSEKLFASAICLIYQNKFEICIRNVEEIISALIQEALDSGIELIKRYLVDVCRNIKQRSESYLNETTLKKVMEPILVFLEKSEPEINMNDNILGNEIKEHNEDEYKNETNSFKNPDTSPSIRGRVIEPNENEEFYEEEEEENEEDEERELEEGDEEEYEN